MNSKIKVDLVILIDTQLMEQTAEIIGNAVDDANPLIKEACDCDFRVEWLGIEGTYPKTRFSQNVRDYLTKECQVSNNLQTKKDNKQDGYGAITDICKHFNWRLSAARSIFYLGVDFLEGEELKEDGEIKNPKENRQLSDTIDEAVDRSVIIHTYFGSNSRTYKKITGRKYISTIFREIRRTYEDLAEDTYGINFRVGGDNDFGRMLKDIICFTQEQVRENYPELLLEFDESSSNQEVRTNSTETTTVTTEATTVTTETTPPTTEATPPTTEATTVTTEATTVTTETTPPTTEATTVTTKTTTVTTEATPVTTKTTPPTTTSTPVTTETTPPTTETTPPTTEATPVTTEATPVTTTSTPTTSKPAVSKPPYVAVRYPAAPPAKLPVKWGYLPCPAPVFMPFYLQPTYPPKPISTSQSNKQPRIYYVPGYPPLFSCSHYFFFR